MQRHVDALRDETFDLLILGGGITGAGVALDAATRGLRVALIDKGDFASGTSSASSKLVHGGLRYLEHGEIALVYEAMQERRRLLHNAPHLVYPLRFVIPFCAGDRVPAWKWRLGLAVYDLLAGRHNLLRASPLSTAALAKDFPYLRPAGLHGAAAFSDAQMDDARLCIEVLRTAAQNGALLANYVEAIAFEPGCVRVVDRVGGAEISIRARQVINATGPWVDTICRMAGDNSAPHLQPTKGVHLVTRDLGHKTAFLLLHPNDGRVLFVIPWLGKTLIGTTDTVVTGLHDAGLKNAEGPDSLLVQPEEIMYLLEAHNHYFEPPLGTNDVISSFAGLRPLIRCRTGEPSSLSREFRIFESPSGLLSIAGGKFTTYRHMAEVATNTILKRLKMHRRCRTHDLPLDGAPQEPWDSFATSALDRLQWRWGLDEASANHLINRYGKRAMDVAAYLDNQPNLNRRVDPAEPDLMVEFVYQREQEMAVHDADCLLRRTRLGLFHPHLLSQPSQWLRLRRA